MEPLNLENSGYKIMKQELKLLENDVGAVSDTSMTKSELIIPTPLWVVYKKNNVIILKDGLDLTMKPYVWGIQAYRNLLISRLLAEDMPDAKEEWKRNPCTDIEFLPNYASRLDYQGRKIVPAKGQDISCFDSRDYDKTAEILQEHGIDCMLWEDKRLKAVTWKGWFSIEQVDATSNFICARIGIYSQTCIVTPSKVFSQNCWVPGRMALWIK